MEHIFNNPEFGENWFDYSQLYDEFVKLIPDGGVFVEVGCWKGKSISYMGVEIINSGKNISCYGVDTWRGSVEHQMKYEILSDTLYQLFLSNIKPLNGVVIPIRGTSIDVSKQFQDETIDVVYIDASHEYEDVKADILAWLPKVKKGGIISGHDYNYRGYGLDSVKKAVDETLKNYNIETACVCSWMVKLPL